MRNIETFPSKQMYPYLSLVERKEAEFYHNIDRRCWLGWLQWLIFIAYSGQLMVSLGDDRDTTFPYIPYLFSTVATIWKSLRETCKVILFAVNDKCCHIQVPPQVDSGPLERRFQIWEKAFQPPALDRSAPTKPGRQNFPHLSFSAVTMRRQNKSKRDNQHTDFWVPEQLSSYIWDWLSHSWSIIQSDRRGNAHASGQITSNFIREAIV